MCRKLSPNPYTVGAANGRACFCGNEYTVLLISIIIAGATDMLRGSRLLLLLLPPLLVTSTLTAIIALLATVPSTTSCLWQLLERFHCLVITVTRPSLVPVLPSILLLQVVLLLPLHYHSCSYCSQYIQYHHDHDHFPYHSRYH